MHLLLPHEDNCSYLLIIKSLIGFFKACSIKINISLIILLLGVNILDILFLIKSREAKPYHLNYNLGMFYQLCEYII